MIITGIGLIYGKIVSESAVCKLIKIFRDNLVIRIKFLNM